ncbi:phosphotransferase family protein [Rhodococcus rhodochrous]|uniref:phosphotransferase family protein n=1 Tax=Rhodococcus rhodochrous TaxID=1829 RepID=UPI001E392E83|nr:phosphotransferase family protein [Rhodococcus rhodochrous]MCB8914006.1 phosphotransferase family protein [Rhodococcus rhodochrous]
MTTAQVVGLPIEEVTRRLESWLAPKLPEWDGPTVTRSGRVTGGSHELLNLTVADRGGRGSQSLDLVIRFDPTGFRKRRTSNIEREYIVQSALGRSGAKVPRVRWLESDTSVLGATFYVMDELRGRVPRDKPPFKISGWVHDLPATTQRTLWENTAVALADLHAVPVEDLKALRRDPDTTDDFAEHVAAWRSNYEWCVSDGGESAAVTDAWTWLLDNLPANRPVGLTWGDARMANVMFEEGSTEVEAFLDWEDVSLGGPLFDLGRLALMDEIEDVWGHPQLPGFGPFDEFAEIWSKRSGTSLDDWGWYAVFTVCYCAGLVARMGARQDSRPDRPAAPSALTLASQEEVLARFRRRWT